jgi:hypothetical protein
MRSSIPEAARINSSQRNCGKSIHTSKEDPKEALSVYIRVARRRCHDLRESFTATGILKRIRGGHATGLGLFECRDQRIHFCGIIDVPVPAVLGERNSGSGGLAVSGGFEASCGQRTELRPTSKPAAFNTAVSISCALIKTPLHGSLPPAVERHHCCRAPSPPPFRGPRPVPCARRFRRYAAPSCNVNGLFWLRRVNQTCIGRRRL